MATPAIRGPFEILTIPGLFKKSALLRRDRIAVRKKGNNIWKEYKYSELHESITKTAAFLLEKNINKGDRVGILGESSPEWIIACLAIQWAGGIAVPLDARLKTFELEHIIEHSGICVLFADKNLAKPMEGCFDGPLVCLDEAEVELSIPDIIRAAKHTSFDPLPGLDDLAIIFYTSGTTGNPKGVMLTHRNIVSNINSIYQMVMFGENDSFFSVLPVSHAYEFTAGNLLPLTVGATITYSNIFKLKEMMEDLKDTEPTIMLTVPLLLEKLLAGLNRKIASSSPHVKGLFRCMKIGADSINSIKNGYGSSLLFKGLRKKMGFGNLRFFVSGGAPLSPKIQRETEEIGLTTIQGYGLTEASPVVSFNPPDRTRIGSAGLPLPGIEMNIQNRNTDGVGEIIVKGPNVMKGYYRNEGATASVLGDDGSLLTGDLGYIDNEGYIFITGRKKSEIITRSGINIYPEEVESVMLESPFIKEIIVLKGYSQRTGDEEVHATIHPDHEALLECFKAKTAEEIAPESIRQLLQEEINKRCGQLADYKKIRNFTIRNEEFPKTATNKIKRYLLIKRARPENTKRQT